MFERRFAANQAARVKHPDAPEKFVDSEVDLDESLRALSALAGYPELYPEFVRLNAVPSILQLLAHDNADVAARLHVHVGNRLGGGYRHGDHEEPGHRAGAVWPPPMGLATQAHSPRTPSGARHG